MSGIYFIINKATGKFYLGSTNNFTQRKSEHFSDLRKYRHKNKYLQEDYITYKDHIIFVEVERVPIEKLKLKEQFYLQKFCGKPYCYNIANRS